jgi:hypothetical protein
MKYRRRFFLLIREQAFFDKSGKRVQVEINPSVSHLAQNVGSGHGAGHAREGRRAVSSFKKWLARANVDTMPRSSMEAERRGRNVLRAAQSTGRRRGPSLATHPQVGGHVTRIVRTSRLR